MTEQWKEALADVAQTELRTKQFLGYWRAAPYVQLWGVIWFAAYFASYFYPQHLSDFWLIGDAIGVIGSVLLSRQRSESTSANRAKGAWAFAIIFGFGILVSNLIGNKPNAISVFWSSLFMAAYMIAGLWIGVRWIILGATVLMLTLLSYAYLDQAFPLAMAFLAGGSLILGGSWLKRAGV